LARKAAAGDAAAFSSLVRVHERRVRGFLRRLCGETLAEDLAQSSFLKAWRAAASYRGEGSYEGWLLRIAWTQFLSDRRRSRPVELALAVDSAPGPEVRIEIDLALATLPHQERAAALLCLGEGWSHGEAAQILGLPLGTLKSQVARARAKLACILEGHQQ
jgi:RNA polymerase sigma-70 factor (ECF subfamily)